MIWCVRVIALDSTSSLTPQRERWLPVGHVTTDATAGAVPVSHVITDVTARAERVGHVRLEHAPHEIRGIKIRKFVRTYDDLVQHHTNGQHFTACRVYWTSRGVYYIEVRWLQVLSISQKTKTHLLTQTTNRTVSDKSKHTQWVVHVSNHTFVLLTLIFIDANIIELQ